MSAGGTSSSRNATRETQSPKVGATCRRLL
jgi:hypothetical protein